jgi:hypothetical protein
MLNVNNNNNNVAVVILQIVSFHKQLQYRIYFKMSENEMIQKDLIVGYRRNYFSYF